MNFEILKNKWPELANLGLEAENYAYSDPQSSMLKLRCFIELIVSNIYYDLKLSHDNGWKLIDKLKNKKFSQIISEEILNKFHAIRIKANKSIHNNIIISSDEIIWLLEEAYQIACWIYKSYEFNANISFKEFIKPIDNGDRLNVLNETIKELKITLENEKNKNLKNNDSNINNEQLEDFKNKNLSVSKSLNLNSDEIKNKISLEEIFADDKLTSSQTNLVGELESFLKDKDKNVFLLKGYAGTGKTFITKGFTEYLTCIGRKFVMAAPTGKAAKVIKEKTGNEAYTIHKTIYSYKDLKEYKVENVDGSETFKFYFELNTNSIDSSNTVFIIDEASMISNQYQEGEFFRFGSGKLLADLLEYIKIDHNDHDKKIIFIGDNAQLPPIGMNFSPSLADTYLKSEFDLNSDSFELTDVVRQEQDSGILENSTMIRNAIKQNIFNKLDIQLDFNDLKHVEHENMLSEYLHACNYKINGDSIIIAHSNSVVDEYNNLVRKHFFPGEEYISTGDKVMAVTNNGNMPIFIYNGDFGLIRNVDTNTIKREVFVREKINDELITTKIPLSFRNVEIGFKNSEDGKSYFFKTLIFENILYRDIIYKDTDFQNTQSKYNLKDHEINRLETVALYVDFVNRAREKGLKPNTEEFKSTIKSDKFFNCLKIKFGYAITCHKAQGSEWDNVFINCKTHQSVLSKDYFRWLYTGITRSSKKLFLIDEPHISYSTIEVDAFESQSKISESVIEYITNIVKDICNKNDVIINDVKHHSYCELYSFSKGDKFDRIQIFYDGKNKIKNIRSIDNNNLPELLEELMNTLHDTKIIMNKDVHSSFSFPETFLEDFYIEIKNKIKSNDIEIIDIEHINYCEKYIFKKDSEIATINFWYNGKKQFKKAPQHQQGSSVELVNKIFGLI